MATTGPRDLPSVPADLPQSFRGILQRLVEEVRLARGFAGDRADMAVTWRDLSDQGIATLANAPQRQGGRGGGSPGSISIPASAVNGEPDLTPPPTVQNLVVTAGMTTVFAQWDAPVYPQGGGNFATLIYVAKRAADSVSMPTFGDAVLYDQAIGTTNIRALPSEASTRWHVWAKFKSVDGVESASPAGGANGAVATTAADVGFTMDMLTGQVQRSHLFSTLGETVDLINAADTVPGSVNARIKSEATLRQDGDTDAVSTAQNYTQTYAYAKMTGEALAGSVSTLISKIDAPTTGNNPTYAALQSEVSTRASLTDGLSAQWTLKLDVNGHVSGFGLASTANNAAPTSAFVVRADMFSISSPSGPGVAAVTPFIVNTTPTTENGVTIAPGVYMDGANIRNLNAAIARLGNAWIDDAKIGSVSAGKITTGELQVGAYVQSTGFISGTQGWRIRGNGDAEFSGVIVRGTVYASAGAIGGSVLGSDYLQSTNFSAGSLGWRLKSDGSFEANGGTFRGAITAASGAIGGSTITSTAVSSPGFVSGSAGWTLKSDGSAEFANVKVRGDVQATSVTANSISTPGLQPGSASLQPTVSGSASSISLVVSVPSGDTWNITAILVSQSADAPPGSGAALAISVLGETTLVPSVTRSGSEETAWLYPPSLVMKTVSVTGPVDYVVTGTSSAASSSVMKSLLALVSKR